MNRMERKERKTGRQSILFQMAERLRKVRESLQREIEEGRKRRVGVEKIVMTESLTVPLELQKE